MLTSYIKITLNKYFYLQILSVLDKNRNYSLITAFVILIIYPRINITVSEGFSSENVFFMNVVLIQSNPEMMVHVPKHHDPNLFSIASKGQFVFPDCVLVIIYIRIKFLRMGKYPVIAHKDLYSRQPVIQDVFRKRPFGNL